MNKYTKKLPKEDLKKFAKEVSKKLVSSDFKNNRVDDPNKISSKQEKKVKIYVKEYFDKAVEKKAILEKKKQAKEAAAGLSTSQASQTNGIHAPEQKEPADEDDLVDLTPDSPAPEVDPSPSVPTTPFDAADSPGLKRKRTGEDTPGDDSETKRIKDAPSPPPPPPPPPADTAMQDTDLINGDPSKEESDEARELRIQEEELQRENEEAMKMDLDGSLKIEEIESAKTHNYGAFATNGSAQAQNDVATSSMNGVTAQHETFVCR